MGILLIHLGSVAALAAAVALACRLGNFRPAICHALWLVVLLKLAAPPLVAWPLGGAFWESMAQMAGSSARSAVETPDRPAVGRVTVVEESGAAAGTADSADPSRAAARVVWVPAALVGLWLAGGAFVLWRIGVQVRRVRRDVAAGSPPPPWLEERLASAGAALGVTPPRAAVTRGPGAACIQIAGAPVLVVSAGALRALEANAWDPILTHELAHLKRRDHWVAWLVLLAGAIWWWNPVYWWARHRIHLYSEMACDAWVVERLPGARRSYAEAIVRVMGLIANEPAPAPALGLAVWSAATQERRLWMIMKATGPCRVSWRPAAAITALALVVTPAWIAPGETAPAGAEADAERATGWRLSLEPAEKVKQDLEKSVSFEFSDIHLKNVLEYVSERWDINIVLDQRAVAPEKDGETHTSSAGAQEKPAYASDGYIRYVNLQNTPLGDALKAMLRPLNLTHQVRGHAVWVTSPELIVQDQAAPLPSAAFEEGDVLKKLGSRVNLEFESIDIRDAILLMSDSADVNFVMDKRAFLLREGESVPPIGWTQSENATDGIIDYINLEVPLGEALYVMTRLLGLTYAVHEEFVLISTPELAGEFQSNKKQPAE